MGRRGGIRLALWLMLLAAGSVAVAQTTTIVVHSGQTVPNGDGTFESAMYPELNNQGEVAFRSVLTGTSSADGRSIGIYRGGGPTGLVEIARIGELAPDGQQMYEVLYHFFLNDAGEVAFQSTLSEVGGGTESGTGVYRGDGLSARVEIARSGDAIPGDPTALGGVVLQKLGDNGRTLISSVLDEATSDGGLFLSDGTSGVMQIARSGQLAPDGNGTLANIVAPTLTAGGQAYFMGTLTGTAGIRDRSGIFRGDGSAALEQVVRGGQSAPDGDGSFSSFGYPSPNEADQVAFRARLSGTAARGLDEGVFRAGGPSGLVEIVRKGAPTSGDDEMLWEFSTVVLNNAGQVAFEAGLRGDMTGIDIPALYRGDGTTSPIEIARAGQASPDGNGTFADFLTLTINDQGQTAFLARMNPPIVGLADVGLYFHDDELGLLEVARRGDAMLGSTIAYLSFGNDHSYPGDTRRRGLNDQGQLAYAFALEDGRWGIALWSPPSVVPEPRTITLLVLGTLAMVARRRRCSN
ncbi:DUF7453 family protein [Aeoliella sp. SH292]|uniref:DUF7453 family protein n=1 Tax=Aeoliella sp. SH292 TaxID=3454464 RepID=UPI003F975BF9